VKIIIMSKMSDIEKQLRNWIPSPFQNAARDLAL
jgi:hypothetical protein